MTKLVRFDWAIKYLLRNKANFDILEGFLSELLHVDIKIESILESESNKNSMDDKYNRVDLLVQAGKKERIIQDVGKEKVAYLSIDIDMLRNPQTGEFFKNPVVNEQEITVEGSPGDPYPNLIIKALIFALIQERNQSHSINVHESAEVKDVEVKDVKDQHPPDAPQIEGVRAADPAFEDVLIQNPAEAALNYGEGAVLNQNVQQIHYGAINAAPEGQPPVVISPIHEEEDNPELLEARNAIQREYYFHKCMKLIIGTLGLWGVGWLIAMIIKWTHNNNNDNQNCQEPDHTLTYSFKMLYETGAKFCLINNGDLPYKVSQQQFTNSVHIKNPEGDKQYIWGDLFPGGSTLDTTYAEGTGYTYDITPPYDIFIPPKRLLSNPLSELETLIGIDPPNQACATFVFDNLATGKKAVTGYSTHLLNLINRYLGTDVPIAKITTSPLQIPNIAPAKGTDVWVNGNEVSPDGICICCKDPAPGYDLSGYWNNWDIYQRQYPVSSIPLNDLNHVRGPIFSWDTNTGKLLSTDAWADTLSLSDLSMFDRLRPYMKNTFVEGGYCTGKQFNEIISDPTKLAAHVSDQVSLAKKFNYKGVTMDIEWWGDDKCKTNIVPSQFSNFFAASRTALGQDAQIDMALPALQAPFKQLEPAFCDIAKVTNLKMLMTYDFNGYPWSGIANYASPLAMEPSDPTFSKYPENLLNIESAMEIYKNTTCFNPNEFGIGIPAYGRAAYVDDINVDHQGLWRNMTGVPHGQFNDTTGFYDYRCIVGIWKDIRSEECLGGDPTLIIDMEYIPTAENDFGHYAKQPWAYSIDQNMVLSFDDSGAAQAKACYMTQNRLNGLMVWDLAGNPNDENSLLKATHPVFKSQGATCPALKQIPKPSVTVQNLQKENISHENKSYFSPEINNFLTAVGKSFLITIVLKSAETLLEKALEKSLAEKRVTEKQKIGMNLFLRLTILSYFNGFSGAATALMIPMLKELTLLERLGISKEISKKAIMTIEYVSIAAGVVSQIISLWSSPNLYGVGLIGLSSLTAAAGGYLGRNAIQDCGMFKECNRIAPPKLDSEIQSFEMTAL